MIRSSRSGRLPLALALSLGCASDAGLSRDIAVRDSAGIRIVENRDVADRTSGWSVATEPILRVGWAEGEPEFQSVYTGFVGDGRVIVGDRGAHFVYVFALSGETVARIGGEGEGPGEFGEIGSALRLDADSFLVSDGRNLRVSTFAGTELAGDVRFESFIGDAGYAPVGRTAEGSFVLVPRIFALRVDEEPGWKRYPILRTDDFSTVDTLTVAPMLMMRRRGDMNPLQPGGATVATGTRIATLRTDRAEIVWRDGSGATAGIARWDAVARDASDADWEVWEGWYRGRTSDRAGQPSYEEGIEAMHRDFGGTIPLFESVFGDSDGNVWLEEADLGRSTSTTFFVVAESGEWLGSVTLPRPMRILDITDDRILGVETDDFDVQSVVLYALEKPE